MRSELTVDWTIPPTPSGWAGRLERLMGPGKTRTESTVELLGGLAGMAAIFAVAAADPQVQDWSPLQMAVGLALALDLVGGVLTNSTNAAKRWYHRPGPSRARARLGFTAVHVTHLAVVAFVLLPGDARWWWTHLVLLLMAAVLIELVPVEVKRPTATAATVVATAAGQAIAPLSGVLVLVPVLFYLKLLVGHLVPEAPLTRRRSDQVPSVEPRP